MTCGSLIFGQVKNVAVNIKGKTQGEQQYCAFRGIKEVEANIQDFKTTVPYLFRVEGDRLSCKRVRRHVLTL